MAHLLEHEVARKPPAPLACGSEPHPGRSLSREVKGRWARRRSSSEDGEVSFRPVQLLAAQRDDYSDTGVFLSHEIRASDLRHTWLDEDITGSDTMSWLSDWLAKRRNPNSSSSLHRPKGAEISPAQASVASLAEGNDESHWLQEFIHSLGDGTETAKNSVRKESRQKKIQKTADTDTTQGQHSGRVLLRSASEGRSAAPNQLSGSTLQQKQLPKHPSQSLQQQQQSRVTDQAARLASSRSAGSGDDTPGADVAAAVTRARRRALEQRRRKAEEDEAAAVALRRRRYGKRDDRLARFAQQEEKLQSVPVKTAHSKARYARTDAKEFGLGAVAVGAGLGLDVDDLDLLLNEELDASGRPPPQPQPMPYRSGLRVANA